MASGQVVVLIVSEPPFVTAVSGRNLVDQHGATWFGVGDAPWALVGQLTTAQITSYLTQRAAQGCRLVLFSAPEVLTTTATGAHVVSSQGTNADGDSDWALLVEVT